MSTNVYAEELLQLVEEGTSPFHVTASGMVRKGFRKSTRRISGSNSFSLRSTTRPASMLLSVDVGHGLHPNKTDKNDPTNKDVLGKGICIKEASGQAYATDSEAIAISEP